MSEHEQSFIVDEHTLYFVCQACGSTFKHNVPGIPWAALPVYFTVTCTSCEKRTNVMLWGDREQGIHITVIT